MPKIEDIRRFNDMLIMVGKEPQVLAERGESVEIPAPGEGPPDLVSSSEAAGASIDSLISDIAAESAETSGAETFPWEEVGTGGEAAEPSEESPFDFENVPLEDLDIGEGHIAGLKPAETDLGDEEPSAESAAADSAESPFDLETFDFDTADYSEEESAEEPVEPEPEPAPEPQNADMQPPEEQSAGETAAGEEPENLFDMGDETFDFDFDQAEEPAPAEEPEGAPSDEGVVFEAPAADEGVGDEFELPDIGEDIFEQEPPVSGEELGPPAEEPAAQEFEPVPDVDFDEADLEAAPGDEEGFETGGIELEEPAVAAPPSETEFPAEETAPASADEFSFDLEEDDLSGLQFEEPAAAAQEAGGAPGGEDEFALPDQEEESAFLPPDESELARQTAAMESVDEEAVDEDVDVDEFNLGDFGAEFGVLEHVGAMEAASEEELNPAISIGPGEGRAGAAPPGEISLTQKQFNTLKRALQTLPLNLKISVEEIIGDGKGSHDQLERLIGMLTAPTPIQDIASLAGRILGRRIVIPRGYEKRSGVAFEEERRSFAYQFRENILPILRVFVLATGMLALVVFLGYRFIYRPLYAQSLYQRGFREIPTDAYTEANNFFARGLEVWPMKDWFYKYAEAFSGKHQYLLAEKKYEQLLNYYPFDKKGTLDYAGFESSTLANYEKAQSILQNYLDQKGNDPQILLSQGDNYMRWAEVDKSHYEDARRSYAFIFQHFGASDPLYMRMLRYFIRTDNQPEVVRLKDFFQADKRRKVDPRIYAELGGYLLDKNLMQDVHDVLIRALNTNDRVPEVHYELARYFARVEDPRDEETALKNARDLFNRQEPLDKRQLGELVDTYGRLGEFYYNNGSDIPAQEALTAGIRRYEDAKRAQLLTPAPMFGKLYSTLGDIYYYKALDYKQALSNFEKALSNRYTTPDLNYKVGYIHYRSGDYEQALKDFSAAAGNLSTNRNLLYATGNALFMRQDYYAAQGYYSDLLDRLRSSRQQIQNLQVSEDPAQRSLIDFLIRTSNNLGITMFRLWERSGRQQDYTEALVNLKDSTEEAGNLSREPQTGVRSGKVDLAYLNMRGILYPNSNFIPQIYRDIPVDMKDLFLGSGTDVAAPAGAPVPVP